MGAAFVDVGCRDGVGASPPGQKWIEDAPAYRLISSTSL